MITRPWALALAAMFGSCVARHVHSGSSNPDNSTLDGHPSRALHNLFKSHSCDGHPSEMSRAQQAAENAYFKAGQGAGGEDTWNYLLTTPFKARHKLAAAEFSSCYHIIEVGARTENINIRHFLSGNPRTVTVVDPAIRGTCEVAHIGGTHNAIYRQIPSGLEDFLETGFDCLLALGLDCWSDEYMEALVQHARHADKVVLGRAVGWKPSEDCARRVEEQLTQEHKLLYRVQLDFSGNTFVKSELCLKEGSACPWTSREMSVFVKRH